MRSVLPRLIAMRGWLVLAVLRGVWCEVVGELAGDAAPAAFKSRILEAQGTPERVTSKFINVPIQHARQVRVQKQ